MGLVTTIDILHIATHKAVVKTFIRQLTKIGGKCQDDPMLEDRGRFCLIRAEFMHLIYFIAAVYTYL